MRKAAAASLAAVLVLLSPGLVPYEVFAQVVSGSQAAGAGAAGAAGAVPVGFNAPMTAAPLGGITPAALPTGGSFSDPVALGALPAPRAEVSAPLEAAPTGEPSSYPVVPGAFSAAPGTAPAKEPDGPGDTNALRLREGAQASEGLVEDAASPEASEGDLREGARRALEEPGARAEAVVMPEPVLPRSSLEKAGPRGSAASAGVPSPIKSKGLKALLTTQFFGAFNDSAFKTLFSVWVASVFPKDQSGGLISLATGLFVLPYILFSAYAGRLADSKDKAVLVRILKTAELGLAVAAGVAFYHASAPALLGVLFLVGAHSAIMSPAKTAYLAERVPEESLPRANGFMEMLTFAGIVLGTGAGGLLLSWLAGSLHLSGLVFAVVGALGLAASLFLPRSAPVSQAPAPAGGNPLKTLWQDLKELKASPPLYWSALAVAYFWFLGSIVQMNLLLFGQHVLLISENVLAGLLTTLAVGIGLGSATAGGIGPARLNLGLVPWGAAGILFALLDLALFGSGSLMRAVFDLALLGFSGGLFYVPLNTYLQQKSAPESRGRVLGLSNLLTFLAILLSAGTFSVLSAAAFNPSAIFVATAVLALGVGAYATYRLMSPFARMALWFLTNAVYRIKAVGLENVPKEGGVLLAPNHVSFVDAFLVAALLPRHVYFYMWRGILKMPFIGPITRFFDVIPVSGDDSKEAKVASLQRGNGLLKEGKMVGIFPEGRLTWTGQPGQFKRGLETVAKDTGAPIIPTHIDGIWGSVFSHRKTGRTLWQRLKALPYRTTVTFGKALPSTSTAEEVRRAVMDLSADAMSRRLDEEKRTLPLMAARQAKRNWFHFAMKDSATGRRLNFGEALTFSVALGWALKAALPANANVGVLVPPTNGAGIVNVALTQIGKVPVNLNYVATSAEVLQATVAKAEIGKVIVSRKALEKLKLPAAENMIMIEDVAAQVKAQTFKLKLLGLALLVLPSALVERWFLADASRDLEATAAILFTTGSTGVPKGVELTHKNILANVQAARELIPLGPEDKVMAAMPPSHAFGLLAQFWLPFVAGFGAVYHTNPTEFETMGKMIREEKATILLAIPSFLPHYIERVPAEDLKSLRFVIVGAEPLDVEVVKAFEAKFGVPVLEGFGATELAPLATLNVVDPPGGEPGEGRELGSIGRPVPGVSMTVVDPEDFDRPLPYGQEGMVLVKGPNVMKGYYKDPEKTAKALHKGRYVTGDLMREEKSGRFYFGKRLAREPKIKGEKVPLDLVEAELHKAAGVQKKTFLVVFVQDLQEGPKVMVVYSGYDGPVEELLPKLRAAGLRPYMLPSADDFIEVDALPTIGIGKADYKTATEIAQARRPPNLSP